MTCTYTFNTAQGVKTIEGREAMIEFLGQYGVGAIVPRNAPAKGIHVGIARAALAQAYGDLPDQLERKGLLAVSQTLDDAIDRAAQMRAAKTGGDVAQIKRSLMGVVTQIGSNSEVRFSVESDIKDAKNRLQSLYNDYAGKPEQDASIDQLEAEIKQMEAEVKRNKAPARPKLEKPSDKQLNARYDSPGDVPPNVRAWVRKNLQIITSDATDAVRWARIENTLNDGRYPDDEEITIYRAVSRGDSIREGDWVTTDREYAEMG